MSESGGAQAASRWIVFTNPGFAFYIAALVLTGFAVQIQTVAVGWQVYDMTRDPFDLGLVGLSQFAPALLLVLVTGAVADRFSRRKTMCTCLAIEGAASGGLLLLAAIGNANEYLIFAFLMVFGAGRAFYNPARQAIVTNIVIPGHLPQAIAMNSGVNQIATICGPVAGGLLYGISPEFAYGVSLMFLVTAAVLIARIPSLPQRISKGRQGWSEITAGFRYIVGKPIILGAISLDLFAVLLGGAFALLPVYARDILDIGAVGLGLLRAAPAIGAICVALYIMSHPITRHVGKVMFAGVAGFGVFTLVFALSETVWLSILALLLIGGFDMVSVLIRNTLVQLHTPDELRGRVNAVNQVFIGASNELGAFRAGTTAAFIGPVAAVAVGAVSALGICALWYRAFPDLRNVSRLDTPEHGTA